MDSLYFHFNCFLNWDVLYDRNEIQSFIFKVIKTTEIFY
ncbi:hypothetical protein BSM4216_0548 [Bacillus smithii]|nr:hypothetical protein BSM4216_0548 [Bacillus smithii]